MCPKLEQGLSVLRELISKEELLWWNSVAAYDIFVINATNKSSKFFNNFYPKSFHQSHYTTAPSAAVLGWMKDQEKVAGGRKVFLKTRFPCSACLSCPCAVEVCFPRPRGHILPLYHVHCLSFATQDGQAKTPAAPNSGSASQGENTSSETLLHAWPSLESPWTALPALPPESLI